MMNWGDRVLHEQQHPVALLYPQRLQIARQGIHLLLEFGEGDGAVVIVDCIPVGITQGRNLQIGIEAGLRQAEVARHILRPDRIVPIKHVVLSRGAFISAFYWCCCCSEC